MPKHFEDVNCASPLLRHTQAAPPPSPCLWPSPTEEEAYEDEVEEGNDDDEVEEKEEESSEAAAPAEA